MSRLQLIACLVGFWTLEGPRGVPRRARTLGDQMSRYELKWVEDPALGRVVRWTRIDPHQRLREIGDAYDHCMNHEGIIPWPGVVG